MCENCGCVMPDWLKDGKSEQSHEHSEHSHHHDHNESVNPLLDEKKTVTILTDIMEKNNHEADHIREHLKEKSVLAINMMSSPGSGKTSLLEKTAEILGKKMAVLEGDLETNKDADRIKAKGVSAYQITTGQSCHLDAFMVHHGLHHLPDEPVDYLFIENVGNLVCPASYDIGTHLNVVLISTPEGDDKVAKYPVMFKNAHCVIISKMDLIEHFEFSTENVVNDVRKLNQKAEILEVSTKDEGSVNRWIEYLKDMRSKSVWGGE
jgi:hydrogenase nickel incorporation protein HypB